MRPIEISDALSKAQEVGKMQQNAEMRPEAAQEFQKDLNAKAHLHQTQSPNPAPQTDQVVIYGDEHEKEKRKHAENREESSGELSKKEETGYMDAESGKTDHTDHIDIKI